MDTKHSEKNNSTSPFEKNLNLFLWENFENSKPLFKNGGGAGPSKYVMLMYY